MKLKQNGWMYLFFTSVLLWVGTVAFSCEATPKEVVTTTVTTEATVPCKITKKDFRLSDSTAMSRIDRYKAYAKNFTPPTNPKAGDIINPDVRYFQLPRCELDKMLEEVGEGGDVKAHLAIKDVTINNVLVQEIVLVFGDSLNTKKNWYDFVLPCPTDCTS